jgi:hypothetical protein
MNNIIPPDKNFQNILVVLLILAIAIMLFFAAGTAYENYVNHRAYDWRHVPPKDTLTKVRLIDRPDSTAVIVQDDSLVSNLELIYFADRISINNGLNGFAGVTGKVTWQYDNSPVKYKGNDDIFIAYGLAENNDKKRKRTLALKLLINRKTKVFKVLESRENGKRIEGGLLMFDLALYGGYAHSNSLE